ncbi:hypothetical protein ACFVT5_26200 [Streptomyces sp. NPDC058001]|uniref:hypothetical protein n=1 Tax=Streptomyces sp. NPDC058001 TaxID=3346300 RepID=UPI0036E22F5D
MSSVNSAASRRVRAGAVTVGLAALFALTGCTSDTAEPSGSSPPSSSSSAPSPSGADAGSGADSGADAGSVEGSWVATNDGKVVALVVTGSQVGLFETGGSVCSGSVSKDSKMQMIKLTCTSGKDNRAHGMVDSVTAGTLKVTWEGGLGTETYRKTKDGQLPDGLPTAGLPTS